MKWGKRALVIALGGSLCLGLWGCGPSPDGDARPPEPSPTQTVAPEPTPTQTAATPVQPWGVFDPPLAQAVASSNPTAAASATPAPAETPAPATGRLVSLGISRAMEGPDYDTKSSSSTCIPDLGAASGYLLSTGRDPALREEPAVTYEADRETDKQAVRDTVEAYCQLLSSLPYLEVAQPLITELSYTSMGWNYTGTGAVTKGQGASFARKTPCDVHLRMEVDSRKVSVWFADGLQVVDTGDRLNGEPPPSKDLLGRRACDSYYYKDGLYRNDLDELLSTPSGKAALLVNGAACTGEVEFRTEMSDKAWAVDKFTVSGFHRSDWVELAFPVGGVETGDVFTTGDFLRYKEYEYATTNKSNTWAFAVSGNNGADFVMPMANGGNCFEGVTVRILQWDETGDTVLYFYGKLLLEGQDYEIEGLLAAPKKAEERSDPGGGSGDCSACSGSGRCIHCGGTGVQMNLVPGTSEWLPQNCLYCNHTGRCRDCNGTGKQ